MLVEVGKYYLRRDGQVVGPATKSGSFELSGFSYASDGTCPGIAKSRDLIAEVLVTDKPTKPPAIERLKKLRDEVRYAWRRELMDEIIADLEAETAK